MTKPWKDFRQEIVRLYIQEGRTLRDVQDIMRRQHGFNASVRSYRQQFDHWGVGKYKCKRRPRRMEFSGAVPPPSPPATPTLPPITTPFDGPKPLVTPLPGDPGTVDPCWPGQRHGSYFEHRESHSARSISACSSFAPSAAIASCQGPGRAYQTPRASLPIMSSHVVDTTAGWMQPRPAYPQGDIAPRDSPSLYVLPPVLYQEGGRSEEHNYSSRIHSHASAMRGPLSPVYLESKTGLGGEVEWNVPRSAEYSLANSDTATLYQGEQGIEPRDRSMQMYTSTSPCGLVAAKNFVASPHLPPDKAAIFGRNN